MVASRIAVAANFTAQAMADTLDFWLRELALPYEVVFAPYDQVFQSLLDGGGTLAGNRDGHNVVLIDRASWVAGAGAGSLAVIDDLVGAVRACADRSGVAHLVVSCPAGSGPPDLLAAAERRLVEGLAADARVRVLTEEQVLAWYPVAERFDPYAGRTADLPYSREMLAALATSVIRTVAAPRLPRPKAIAVDADHTLWEGVVGEDGPLGVRVTPAHRRFQEYLLEQRAGGRLLCVVSRNLEADVRQVLATHPDMVLRAEHITGWRVNWLPKSENLAALARELDLGLDSLVLLDDNPVERAEVQAAHPRVYTPALPDSAAEVTAYLRRCWPLDFAVVTDDDRARARRYQQDAVRAQARTAAPSLAEFLATLDLRVEVRPLAAADLARAAQLAHRVNQFNLTTRRYQEPELAAMAPGRALVIEARDRFGDYGLVGLAVLAAGAADPLEVENLLLSCRVLGRGVEHAVLRQLGRLARERGLAGLLLRYAPSARNQPALRFLETLPAAAVPAVGYRLGAAAAAAVTYQPGADRPATPSTPESAGSGVDQSVLPADLLHRVATDLGTAAGIVAAVDRRPAFPAAPGIDSADPVERAVAAMWAELLDHPPASVHDDFYQLGGDSLLALRFAAQVREEYGLELPAGVLFTDSFTVATMALAIRELRAAGPGEEALADLLVALERLSDDEVRGLLDDERA